MLEELLLTNSTVNMYKLYIEYGLIVNNTPVRFIS